MNLIWLFEFLILSFSINYMVVSSRIFSPVRNFFIVKTPFIGDILSCIQCFGFWSGFFVFFLAKFGPVVFHGLDFSISQYLVIDLLCLSLFSSLFSVLGNSILVFLNK